MTRASKSKLDRLKKDSIIVEAYFTSLFWNNPENYNFYNDETVKSKTFMNNIWGFFFALGRYMHNKGVKEFDDITVANYVKELKVNEKFANYGGYNTVYEVMQEVEGLESNLEAYYNEIKKNDLLKHLSNLFGADKVLKNSDTYNYKEMSKNDIFLYWTDKVNQLGMDGDNSYDEHNLTEGLEEAIDDWDKNPDIGLPFYKSINLTKISTGWDFGNLYILGGFGGSGKAQDLDSNIMTPNGYVKMRDIEIGDEIFGDDGNIHHVTGVFPQGEKDMYEVIFSDGSKTITCDEHLWNVQRPHWRNTNKFTTLTLRQIMDEGLYKERKGGYKNWNHYIPMTKPLNFIKKNNLKIDSYLLGLLIGDGTLSSNHYISLTININENDLFNYLEEYCNENNLQIKKKDGVGCIDCVITGKTHGENNLKDSLRELGLIPSWSHSKFIPKEYLYSSIESRIDLLSGLIDSDGSISGSNYVYTTVSHKLAEDVKFLVQSLGGTAKIRELKMDNDKNKNQPYKIYIKMPKNIQAFKSEKHRSKFKVGQTDARRTIREINYLGKREAQCIKTSNPTELYLTDEMIVTHNTSFSFNKVIMSCLENKEKLLIIANEQSISEFKKMLLVTAMGTGTGKSIKRQRLNEGSFTEEERSKLDEAVQWVRKLTEGEDAIVKFVFMENYIIEDVKKIVRHYSNRGYKSVMIDTGKPSDDPRSTEQRHAQFADDFKELYKLARANGGGMNLRMWVNVQLTDTALTRRYLNEHAFGESKKIKNEASVVYMIRGIWDDEYEGGSHELECYKYVRSKKSGKKYEKKTFTLEKGEVYYLVFTPKNRRGQDNKTGLDILIVKPNFNNNTWDEVGWCFVADDRNY